MSNPPPYNSNGPSYGQPPPQYHQQHHHQQQQGYQQQGYQQQGYQQQGYQQQQGNGYQQQGYQPPQGNGYQQQGYHQQQQYQQGPYNNPPPRQQQQQTTQSYQQQYNQSYNAPAGRQDTYIPVDKSRVPAGGFQEDSHAEKCNDWFCAIIFVVHVLGMIGLSIYYIRKLHKEDDERSSSSNGLEMKGDIVRMVIYSSVLSIVFALFWFGLIRKQAAMALRISLYSIVAIYGICGALFLYFNIIAGAVIMFLMAGLQMLYIYCIRRRIPFAEALLSTSSDAMSYYWGTLVVGFVSLIASIGYCILWVFAVNAGAALTKGKDKEVDDDDDENSVPDNNNNQNNKKEGSENDTSGVLWFGFVLSLYWTMETIANIGVTTVSGTVCTWWKGSNPAYGTMKSFCRSITYSLGSIALGSFFVAFLQTIRYLIRSSSNQRNGLVQCCLLCLIGMIEGLLRLFNQWAYVQVALYGKSFCTAAGDTLDLFRANGFEMIANDDLSSIVVVVGSVIGGVFNAALVGTLFYLHIKDHNVYGGSAFLVFFMCFLIGYIGAMLILSAIPAAVRATLVMWCEQPDVLQAARPVHTQRLVDAKQKAYDIQ